MWKLRPPSQLLIKYININHIMKHPDKIKVETTIKSNKLLYNRWRAIYNSVNADLRNADLRWANLRWANLENADLRNADLRNVDLENADLSWANLENANLENANLRRANLENADLRGVAGKTLISFTASQHTPVYDVSSYLLHIGCMCYYAEHWALIYAGVREAEGYTPEQITEYKAVIDICLKIHKR